MRHFLFAILILSISIVLSLGKFHLEYQWKYVDFVWESQQHKLEALNSGRYNASAIYLYDVDKAPDGRVFVTMVRDKGAPVGLATVTNEEGKGGLLLRPYPDWSWYKEDCNGITAGVYQVEIKCNHLFLVDGGMVGIDQICSPQLLIFDLSTDKLVKRLIIPFELAHNNTGDGLLTSVFVYSENCTNIKDNAIILMADEIANGLVIYNSQIPKLCRIETEFMKPTKPGVTINNKFFPLADGIFSFIMINKDLYYSAFGGSKIYKMEFSKISKCTLSNSEATKQTQLVSDLAGQTTMLASADCVIFFNSIADYTISCADATKNFNFKNNAEIIARDPEKLQFLCGFKNRNDELLILSNRYQNHVYETLDINEVNFRIFSMPFSQLKEETKCFDGCSK